MEKAALPAAKKPKEDQIYRTVRASLPKALEPACRSVARHVRDVHNASLWLGKKALGCFERDRQTKAWRLLDETDRPEGWAEALAAFDGSIAKINAGRKKKKKGKLLTPLASGSNPNPYSTILDLTAFHMAARERPDGLDPEKRPASSRLPSSLGKAAREHVRESLSTFLKSLHAWKKAGAQGGMPRMPGFAKKNQLPGFTFPLEKSTRRLPNLDDFDLRTGEDKSGILSPEDKAAWSSFELRRHLEASVAAWAQGDEAKKKAAIKSVRVRFEDGEASLDIALAIPRRFPEDSFFAELKNRYPEAWAKWGKDPALLEGWVQKLLAKQTWNAQTMNPKLPESWISQGFEAVGVDPGQNNLLTLGFSSGARMRVFAGAAFERKAANFDARVDKLLSKLTTGEQRDLQAKIQRAKGAGEAPAHQDLRRLRELSQAAQVDPRLKALRRQKRAYVKAEAHRLAKAVANVAREQKAAAVILSRNKGWKEASGLSSKAERRAHNIPHAFFAKLLREKLEGLGIATVETEESFTSQASFVDGEPMPVHAKGKAQEAAKARKLQAKLAKAEKGQTSQPEPKPHSVVASASPLDAFKRPQPSAEHQPALAKLSANDLKTNLKTLSVSGKRVASDSQKPKHWFVRQGPLDARSPSGANPHRRRRLHADGQGALNAIRKVCPTFACSSKVNLGHDILMLRSGSWRLWAPAGTA